MKTLYLLLISGLGLLAQSSFTPSSTLLTEVNPLWLQFPTALSDDESLALEPTSDAAIQYHLMATTQFLEERSLSHLTSGLQQRRKLLLNELKNYAQEGLFPQNLNHPGRRPVFIDHRGVHCAVGHLIAASGRPELSRKISRKLNYHYLLDMEDEELAAWVANSGFTPLELALIQPGYPRVVPFDKLKGGVNRPVFTLLPDSAGGLYAGGLFDSAGQQAKPYWAHYYSGFAGYDWGGSIPSPSGPVYDAIWHKGDLYIAGAFHNIDTVLAPSGIARWDGNHWHGLGEFYIGAQPNEAYSLAFYRDTLYAGGILRNRPGASDKFRNLCKWDGTEWRSVIAGSDQNFYGIVRRLLATDSCLWVAGEFSLANIPNSQNIFGVSDSGLITLSDTLALPVNDIAHYGGELYAATPYLSADQQDTAGLVVYRNDHWQPLVDLAPYRSPRAEVHCLEETDFGLAFGGDFMLAPAIGVLGHNYALWRGQYAESIGSVDSTVLDLLYQNQQLYLAGNFKGSPAQGDTLSHVASIPLDQMIGLEEQPLISLQIYPNPSQGILRLVWGEEQVPLHLRLYDLQGRLYHSSTDLRGDDKVLKLTGVAEGSYILEVEFAAGTVHQKLLLRH